MNIVLNKNNLILSNIKDFDIEDTLECGQCFRFTKLNEKEYLVVAKEKELYIKQKENKITFYDTTEKEFLDTWVSYFDLNRDYGEIKKYLSKDKVLKEAIEFGSGIRILNQEPWECLISFIISQNNRIPMIKKVIENISLEYGKKINNQYAFPSVEALQNTTEEKLRECKTGFRAKYIKDATEKVYFREIDLSNLEKMSTNDIREELIKISGVGPKVSECVALFGFSRKEAFPIDVWIKRIMEYFYFGNENIKMDLITQFAKDNFGNFAGFAQQYLFHYARIKKIGT